MSVIENGLRADIMRKRMEDKNTLQHKGSLYVGTGNSESEDNKITYETEEFVKGNSGEVLLCKIDPETQSRTLKWAKDINTTVINANHALKTTFSSFSSVGRVGDKLVCGLSNKEQTALIPFSDISSENFLFYCEIVNNRVDSTFIQKKQYICFGINAKIDNDFKIIYVPPSDTTGTSTEVIIHQTAKDQILSVDCSNLFKVEDAETTRITVYFYVRPIM